MARSTFAVATAAVALSFASTALAQNVVNTPSLYQCTAAAITYTCANPPCTIVARPSGDATQALESFGEVTAASGSVSWKPVNVAEGTQVTFWITDDNGESLSSASVTVSGGSSDSCLTSSGSSGSSATSAASDASTKASSATSAAASAASSAASKASSAASSAGSAASSAGASATQAGASASASANADNAAGALVAKGSVLGAALLAVTAYLA
ncbi:hypothetical protein JCM10450v2_001146 [Rhodotorula kratochvilovae]